MNEYWQIAAGSEPEKRDYSKWFLKYGMAFVGRDFEQMKKISVGDIVILKQGTGAILAAGTVVERNGKHGDCGDKAWLRDFDGWDLPAYCYVDWKKPSEPVRTSGLTRSTIQRSHQPEPRAVADEILNTGKTVKPEPEPSETREIEDAELLKFLVKEGLRPSAADELTHTVAKVRLLADYYYHHCQWQDVPVLEHETRTFLVVPLLLALGWAQQQLKIELKCNGKGRVDIACFSENYAHDNHDKCVAIIETKGFSFGLDYAQAQAEAYSEIFPNCQTLITTNGYCYKIYRKATDSFLEEPSAYLNLLKPRDKYPLDPENVEGAFEAIKWLLPNTYIKA